MKNTTILRCGRTLLGGALALGISVTAITQVFAEDAAMDVPVYEGVEALDSIKLTYAQYSAAAQSPHVQAFADYVNKASGGKIEIEVFWASALMSASESAKGIAAGLADLGSALPVYTPADFPVTNWLNALSNQFPPGQPYGKLVSGGANSEFHVLNDDVRREYDKNGLHILGAAGGAAYDMMCNKPVADLEQAKGKRVRSPNQAFAREVEALGMVAVPIVISEVYEAYSRGIIDCVILYPWGYNSYGLTGVGGDNYWIRIPLSGWMATLALVNKGVWDGLPPVAQRILTDGYATLLEVDAAQTLAGTVKFGDSVREGKVQVLEISDDMMAALKAHQAKIVAELAANAPEGVTDPQQAIDQFMELMKKWSDIVSNDLGIPAESADANEVNDAWHEDHTAELRAYQQRVSKELAAAYAAAE
ncbi:hypothetical protein ABGN05_28535 [Aquibium sp. LZ166]|uniref:C4-dicarboxylate ABC transporter substrate-binding protein n=1 Tax=Aquibium pacificus TaxID=3153579 RepID=A0ABV3SVM4_9HYPH